MDLCDREYKRKLNLYKKYVDDTNLVGRQNTIWSSSEGEQTAVTNKQIIEVDGMPDYERTLKLLQFIAESINASIRMRFAYISKYTDGNVPMLNVKVWID